jgi:5,10-methylenetetrahydrofolate reductase
MDGAGPDRNRAEQEGLAICLEILEELRTIPGLRGFHLMPIHWEDAVPEIVSRARLRGTDAVPPLPAATRFQEARA